MADNTNSGWESAPQGASSLQSQMYANDAYLQQVNPQWPTGGTASQLRTESNFNPNAVSPKGARGLAQVMDPTREEIEKQTGRKLDPHNVNDSLFMQRYIMEQNLKKFGSPQDALSAYNGGWDRNNWNNPETQAYPDKVLGGAEGESGWESAQPKAGAGDDAGWENAPTKQQPSAGKARALQALQSLRQTGNAAVDAVQGLGEAQVSMLTGVAGMAAGGIHSLYDLATGRSDQATADIARDEKAMTFQPRTPEGQAILGRAGTAFDVGVGAAKQGASATISGIEDVANAGRRALGMTPLEHNATAEEVARTAVDIGANVVPFLGMFGEGAPAKPGLGAAKVPGMASELDKLNAGQDQATNEFVGPQRQGMQGEPNEGPQRPAFIVDAQGRVTNPLVSPTEQYANLGRQEAIERVQEQARNLATPGAAEDLFPETLTDTTGHATPYGQVERDMALAEQEGRPLTQAELERGGFREESPQGTLNFDRPTGREIQARVAQLRDDPANSVDPMSEQPHPAEAAPIPRTLAPDEFRDAVNTLAEREPDKYSVPVDMDKAYERYQSIVGEEVNPKSYASRFAQAVRDQMRKDRVTHHPTVKANQARVDSLTQKLTDAQMAGNHSAARNVQRSLDTAKDTLKKSQDNIGKALGDDPYAPNVGPDGTVQIFTFGHLPTLMRSIGALLKAMHGVVFKTLDRLLPNFKNLDSTAKQIGQGIKDFVRKEATRDWSQTVNEKPRAQIGKVAGLREGIKEYLPYEAQEITPEELKNQFTTAKDIGDSLAQKIAQNVIQGGLQMTNLTRHPLIKYVTESVDRAARNSRAYVRDRLIGPNGLRTKMQAMSPDELTGIRMLMELNEGKKVFTENELRHQGYSQKQIDYYKQGREETQAAFARNNNARVAAGLKPITERIAHIAGLFMGDFRRVITDKDGKVVAVIAHNYRPAVETITKRFMETHPDAANLEAGPIKLRKLKESIGASDNRFDGYTEILNMFADSDSHMQAVADAYQHYLTSDAQRAMADRAKFKQKEGVIGAEGRKAWQTAQQNAVDGARAQLHYLESLNKWAEMQEAIGKTKGFLADPEITKNSPNAVALAQDYLDSVQGRNRGAVQMLSNAILNGVAEQFGVGPSILKNMNNLTKSILLAKFVGIFKLSHSAVTMLQPFQALPTLNARIRARGADLGATSLSSVGKALSSSFGIFAGQPKTAFDSAAHAYMLANGTADVGMSAHLQNVTKGSARSEGIRHIAELNVRLPEQGARTFTFMYYAHMLKDLAGGDMSNAEIFGTAHNLMRDAMVDYAPHERSLMFGKMGILGDIASTLTRFKYNQIGQHMVGWQDMVKGGHAAPLATTIIASVMVGGVRGVFAYEAANQVVDKLSTGLAKLGVIKQPTSLNELILKGLHGMNTHLADAINFGLPSMIGRVNMTGSLTNADSIPVDPMGALFPTANEFSNLANASGTFLAHPNKNTLEKAVMQWAPNSMKGMLEDAFFTHHGNYQNPNTGKLEARRGTTEEIQRAASFRPLQEGKEGLIANVEKNKEEQLNSVKKSVVDHAFSDFLSGKMTPQLMHSYAQRYVELGADVNDFVKDYTEFVGMDQNRTRLERAQGIPGNDLSSISKYLRVEGTK